MKNKQTVSETLRKIVVLEEYLKELTQLSDLAFTVFASNISLNEMNQVLESSWKKLANWNAYHKEVQMFYMQSYPEIIDIFSAVTSANINRDEFKNKLAPSCNSIETCINKIQSAISEEAAKLHELYNEFVQKTGELNFIFASETVEKLIMNELLRL